MLQRIEIKKLFDQFDYNIELKSEGITILTGPNGYGKTTILRIIHAFSRKDFFFFVKLLFREIIFYLKDGDKIRIVKKNGNIVFTFPNEQTEEFSKGEINKRVKRLFENALFQRIDAKHWVDERTDEIMGIEAAITKASEMYDIDPKLSWKSSVVFPDVYLIREQRLIRPVVAKKRIGILGQLLTGGYEKNEVSENFVETITQYARELKEQIKSVRAESSKITQDLDSSFPSRLFAEEDKITEDDFSFRFKEIKETQEKLSKYGLSGASTEQEAYKEDNAQALKVYLDDTKKKLSIFDELLKKLDAFTTMLDEHHFSSKRLQVSPEHGFEFLTENNHSLDLTALSSGEQQEVVLLYELLFKVEPGALVLIDEPEISLHVAWQKEFLKDIFSVIKVQQINVIMATHSPQIINDRWDLTVNLEETGK